MKLRKEFQEKADEDAHYTLFFFLSLYIHNSKELYFVLKHITWTIAKHLKFSFHSSYHQDNSAQLCIQFDNSMKMFPKHKNLQTVLLQSSYTFGSKRMMWLTPWSQIAAYSTMSPIIQNVKKMLTPHSLGTKNWPQIPTENMVPWLWIKINQKKPQNFGQRVSENKLLKSHYRTHSWNITY